MKCDGKIKYILPDFLEYSRNEIIIDIYENHPEVIRPETCIHSFFGIFPNAIWNGGGYVNYYENTKSSVMKKTRDFYNKKGIPIAFTFTNQLITKEHLNDPYCNQMLEIFHNGMNEILVVSNELEKYIREKFPKYKINRSIINTEKIPFLLEDYNLSVMSKFKNRDFEFINNLSMEERSKTELLCNEFCVNNCPYAYQHYREYAYIQLYGGKPTNCEKKYGTCRFKENPWEFLEKRIKNSNYWISYKDIIKTYMPMGFQYYKLGGRGKYNFTTLEFFIEYMIKPEYQMDVRTYIMERYFLDFRMEVKAKLKIPELAESLNASDWTYL